MNIFILIYLCLTIVKIQSNDPTGPNDGHVGFPYKIVKFLVIELIQLSDGSRSEPFLMMGPIVSVITASLHNVEFLQQNETQVTL